MRVLAKNAADTFRVKAYAGTNGVLLAFDVAEQDRKGLLGFAIQQKEPKKDWEWLLNSRTFPGVAHTIPQWNATPTNLAPIQKFRWGDYSIAAGIECSYRVHPVYGKHGNLDLRPPLELTVKTADGMPKGHQVHFNRAVAASQGFGRKFPEVDKLLSKNKGLPVEEWGEKPRKWLENGLLDGILKFIAKAKDDSWALDVAIYEYELASIVEAVNAAHKRGVKLRVVYHAKDGDEQTGLNEASLKKIPKASKRARVTDRIFHDKFIVLSKLDATGKKRTPKAVLCGSTNFTENGVYRQANVVHTIEGGDCAQKYLDLFEVLWKSPEDVAATKAWINQNNPMDPASKLFVGFSPRSGKKDLAEFANLINLARSDLLFATAFELPKAILEALLGTANDPVLRYGIQNTKSEITGYHADRTAMFVAPALLDSGLEGWIKEGLRGQKGRLLIHTKAVVVNFTSDDPIVLSGSHNLSGAASEGNDENFLIIRGDTDLADRYGIEVLRFYEHYQFRYWMQNSGATSVEPLATDESWTQHYYTPGDLKQAARLRFAGR